MFRFSLLSLFGLMKRQSPQADYSVLVNQLKVQSSSRHSVIIIIIIILPFVSFQQPQELMFSQKSEQQEESSAVQDFTTLLHNFAILTSADYPLMSYLFPSRKDHIKWPTRAWHFIVIRRFIFLPNATSMVIYFKHEITYTKKIIL